MVKWSSLTLFRLLSWHRKCYLRAGSGDDLKSLVSKVDVIGDVREVHDIFSAVLDGYELASRY